MMTLGFSPTTPLDDTEGLPIDDCLGDLEITPESIVRPHLVAAEAAIEAGNADLAEDELNQAAAMYRVMRTPNRSRKYRRLSREVFYLRSEGGKAPEDFE